VRTVNSPANKLKPRATYHLDLAVLALLTGATSLCGLPWMCAATVESINHIRSMTVFGGSKGAPAKEKKKKKRQRRSDDVASLDDAGAPPKGPAEALSETALADLRMMFDSLDDAKTGAISSDKLVSLLRSRSLGEAAWSKWPSWQGHIGPPRSPQTAFEGLRLLYALGRTSLSAQTTAGSDGPSARGHPS